MKFHCLILIAAALSHAYTCRSQSNVSPESVRLKHNNPGLIVDLGVGLWANPIPVDWDRDGDTDLLVSTSDKPSNGLYFFENEGNNVFSPGKKIAEGKKQMTVSWPGGKMSVCTPGVIYPDFRKELYSNPANTGYKQEFYSGRANQWKYADYNGDSIFDLVIGISDWREYGWDDAFNSDGVWTNGPLHGTIYWIINNGSNESPEYGKARKILADDKPLDVFGKPSPNLVDWDNDGDLDLLINSINTTLYLNIGKQGEFVFQNAGDLSSVVLGGHSTSPTTVDWNGDGVCDLLIGAEDGFFYYLPRDNR